MREQRQALEAAQHEQRELEAKLAVIEPPAASTEVARETVAKLERMVEEVRRERVRAEDAARLADDSFLGDADLRPELVRSGDPPIDVQVTVSQRSRTLFAGLVVGVTWSLLVWLFSLALRADAPVVGAALALLPCALAPLAMRR